MTEEHECNHLGFLAEVNKEGFFCCSNCHQPYSTKKATLIKEQLEALTAKVTKGLEELINQSREGIFDE